MLAQAHNKISLDEISKCHTSTITQTNIQLPKLSVYRQDNFHVQEGSSKAAEIRNETLIKAD